MEHFNFMKAVSQHTEERRVEILAYSQLTDRYNNTGEHLSRTLEERDRLKAQLEEMESCKVQELHSRDEIIKRLRQDIDTGKCERAQLLTKLEALEDRSQVTAEADQDFDEQHAEIVRLKEEVSRLAAEATSQQRDSNSWKDRASALTCELESANLSIQTLQKAQGDAESNIGPGSHHLQQEDEAIGIDNSLQTLQDEKISLAMQLKMVKDNLREHLPGLDDDFNNLQSLLSGYGGGRRKKRKSSKIEK